MQRELAHYAGLPDAGDYAYHRYAETPPMFNLITYSFTNTQAESQVGRIADRPDWLALLALAGLVGEVGNTFTYDVNDAPQSTWVMWFVTYKTKFVQFLPLGEKQ